MKIVFNQVKNKIWKRCCLGLALLLFHSNHPIDLLCICLCILGTANLRNNSLLVRTISIACMIPSQTLNLIFIGVVLGRSLGESSGSALKRS